MNAVYKTQCSAKCSSNFVLTDSAILNLSGHSDENLARHFGFGKMTKFGARCLDIMGISAYEEPPVAFCD